MSPQVSDNETTYTCPNCGLVWTEEELYEALFNNEDWIVLTRSCDRCPECYEGELN